MHFNLSDFSPVSKSYSNLRFLNAASCSFLIFPVLFICFRRACFTVCNQSLVPEALKLLVLLFITSADSRSGKRTPPGVCPLGVAGCDSVSLGSQAGEVLGQGLALWAAVPSLQDLMPAALSWSWSNSNRNEAHSKCEESDATELLNRTELNKCNEFESSPIPRHPTPTNL